MKNASDDDDEFFLDPELHLFVDGRLPPDRAAVVEARLAGNPEMRRAVAGWAETRTLIREVAAAADDGRVDMHTELLARELSRRVRASRLRGVLGGPALRQLAASIVIFAAGWTGHAIFSAEGAMRNGSGEEAIVQTAVSQSPRGTILDVLSATDDRMLAAMQRLSTEGGQPVVYPDLQQHGWTLVGGHVLDGPSGQSVRLYYESGDAKRVSVVMMRHPAGQPDYPYQVRSVDGQSLAYMTRNSVDYAILGEEDPVVLATLASALR